MYCILSDLLKKRKKILTACNPVPDLPLYRKSSVITLRVKSSRPYWVRFWKFCCDCLVTKAPFLFDQRKYQTVSTLSRVYFLTNRFRLFLSLLVNFYTNVAYIYVIVCTCTSCFTLRVKKLVFFWPYWDCWRPPSNRLSIVCELYTLFSSLWGKRFLSTNGGLPSIFKFFLCDSLLMRVPSSDLTSIQLW